MANRAKRAAAAGFRLAARVRPGIRRPPEADPGREEDRLVRDLEFAVDLHTFEPVEVEGWAESAGFRRVRTETEELASSLFGWSVRTLEAMVRPDLRSERWGTIAYETWP